MIKENANTLQGNGILEKIFHLLWHEDPMLSTKIDIAIPDTVIFEFNKPIAWYFSTREGLKRKTKQKLTIDIIYDEFKKNDLPCGIAACFMNYPFQRIGSLPIDKNTIIFEYLTINELENFLYDSKREKDGILQKFIQPKGEHNFVIKVEWSPIMCFFEKRENIKKINDKKIDIYERVVTTEAKEFQCLTTPLKGCLVPNSLEAKSNMIVCVITFLKQKNDLYEFNIKHIRSLMLDQIDIKRFTLYFKLDSDEKIWFLYGSNLRFIFEDTDNKKIDMSLQKCGTIKNIIDHDYLKFNVPSTINLQKQSRQIPLCFKKIFKCINCDNNLDPDEVVKIKYSNIVKGFETDHFKSMNEKNHNEKDYLSSKQTKIKSLFKHALNEGRPIRIDIEDYNIPEIIRKCHPSLKSTEYKLLKYQPGFLNKQVIVCLNCYIDITQSLDIAGGCNVVMHHDTMPLKRKRSRNLSTSNNHQEHTRILNSKILTNDIKTPRIPDINSNQNNPKPIQNDSFSNDSELIINGSKKYMNRSTNQAQYNINILKPNDITIVDNLFVNQQESQLHLSKLPEIDSHIINETKPKSTSLANFLEKKNTWLANLFNPIKLKTRNRSVHINNVNESFTKINNYNIESSTLTRVNSPNKTNISAKLQLKKFHTPQSSVTQHMASLASTNIQDSKIVEDMDFNAPSKDSSTLTKKILNENILKIASHPITMSSSYTNKLKNKLLQQNNSPQIHSTKCQNYFLKKRSVPSQILLAKSRTT